jgi:acetyl-CoA carboxylase carboxyl transferase subunit alpha
MDLSFLDFERPIAELEAKIEELRHVGSDSDVNINEEISRLKTKSRALTRQIFSNLTSWQVAQLARHPRGHTRHYIQVIFTDFRSCTATVISATTPPSSPAFAPRGPSGDDHRTAERRDKQKVHRNFGMAKPEGYRKALRLLQLAERFGLPVLTFIDTPGAYPGIGAEERGQSEAIARNLLVMSRLKVPIIVTVIGEGGSGGALAIGVGDRVVMLQYSIYSVISPEGCASILWRSAEKAAEAAEAMGITAPHLRELELIDTVIQEPLGGAHRDWDAISASVKDALIAHLAQLDALSSEELLEARYQRPGPAPAGRRRSDVRARAPL